MIVPSIDLMDGEAVQLVEGREPALNAGDPRPIADRFALAGPVAVIDLDAAMGNGSNEAVIRDLVRRAPCRVGGGIRTVDRARQWLDAGAEQVILGTAATPDVLRQLPRERVIAALDARDGEIMVEGWKTPTGRRLNDQIEQLRPYVGGFLITFIEREGRLGGIDLDAIRPLVEQAGDAHVTVAGGVTTPEDIAALDSLGADGQVGMALYTNRLNLADAITAPMTGDRSDGLWPTVVADEHGVALGMCYSNAESVRKAVETQRGVYWSRSRGLWEKGATSGAGQELVRIDLDCDRDCLRFTVRQNDPGFCHEGTRTCWGEAAGIGALCRTIARRCVDPPAGSYTARLLNEPDLLAAKLREEADELARAADPSSVVHEAADVLYFTMTAMAKAGVRLEDVERELDHRAGRITRRPGHAKVALPDEESSTP